MLAEQDLGRALSHHRAVINPMFAYDEAMADLVFAYCRQRLALDPVPLDFGGSAAIGEALEGLMTPDGHDAVEVLRRFEEHLAVGVVSCDSPRFLSFIPAAPTKAALLFDMVVSCSSLQGTSWLEAAGAVAAENQALRVIADLAGLPQGAGGCFVAGGTAGNLSALLVARDTARRAGRGGGRPRVACTPEAHSSVGRSLHVLGLEPLLVKAVDHHLTGDALAAALEADERPEEVVAVVATAGTTNAGLVDDLAGVGALARARSLWFHVDAAYGGAGLFSSLVRDKFTGIEQADSFIADPHKWLFAPFDCAALLYREPRLARAVHTQDAAYLDVIHEGDASGWNPSDYALHLTRRARGLPLWFSLAVYGTDAYRDAIDTVVRTARGAARLIEEAPHLELVRAPELSVVLYRRKGWARPDYEAWSARLLADQIGFVLPTTWEDEPVARLAFLHPDTELDTVREILDSMA
ncbi:MAG: putative aromatic amino acid decarboxylase [Acidimicrobiaceae bacterium]|nr:putative aromatic amino acid decarboxylase [Acidimicrobiaceae bacterium]